MSDESREHGGARAGHVVPPLVTPAEAASTLRRVLNSTAFTRAPRSRDFLAYVAAETLAGRGARLHERTIARYGLERGAGFDGRDHSVTRVRATRVRTALRDYYADEGRRDEITISLPPGSYVPVFARSDATSAATRAGVRLDPASVAVIQLDPLGDPGGDAALLTQNLVARLRGFTGLRVVLAARRHATDVRGIGFELGVRFVLLCSVSTPRSRATVLTQLLDADDGRLLWSTSSPVDLDDAASLELETWSADTAARLGDYAGLILRQVQSEAKSPGTAEGSARNAFYRHIAQGGKDTLLEARAELSDALTGHQTDAELNAMLAFIVGAGLAYGISTDIQADQTLTGQHARAALALDPESTLAHLALSLLAISRRDWDTCAREARTAAELSPDHPSHLFSAGGALANAGDWPGGISLMRRSFELNPFHPPYQHANLALERLLANDLAGALSEASIVDEGGGVWGPACRAMALHGLGHVDQARAEMKAAYRYLPELEATPEILFADLNLTNAQRARMLDLISPFRESESSTESPGHFSHEDFS